MELTQEEKEERSQVSGISVCSVLFQVEILGN